MRIVVSLSKSMPVLLFALSCAQPVLAQMPAPPVADGPSGTEIRERWEPLGMIPVDEAGAGRRGYVLPGEGADVIRPGASRLTFHAVAANNFYREETRDFLITQRYEAH